MSNTHTLTFTAAPDHIDELGHVNNTIWLQWVQDIALSHWFSDALPEHQEAYFWVVTRHEIDYRGNIGVGESVSAVTFIPDPPQGARFDRRVDFRTINPDGSPGKVIVSARSTWAIIDRASQRILRVPKDVAAPFEPFGEPA